MQEKTKRTKMYLRLYKNILNKKILRKKYKDKKNEF